MKLLIIQPSDVCNLNCSYCSFKNYKRHGRCVKHLKPASVFLNWIDNFCSPNEWIIHITGGGEPTMMPDIDTLLTGLLNKGYYIILQTNGVIPVQRHPKLLRVATWHGDYKPCDVDKIIILKEGDWKAKKVACEYLGKPYIIRSLVDHDDCANRRVNDRYPTKTNALFTKTWLILASGNMKPCNRRKLQKRKWVHEAHHAPDLTHSLCPTCPFVYDIEQLMTDEMKNFCRQYYNQPALKIDAPDPS